MIVATLVASCGTVHVRKPVNVGLHNPTLRTMHLHADVGFKPDERKWIAIAADNVLQQSAGTLDVHVTYDLDFDSTLSVVSHSGDDLLVRAPQDAPYVVYEDSTTSRLLGVVAGVDLANYSMVGQKRIYLVADRLWTPEVFEHVAMHEMLHAFGLVHVDDPDAVMFYQVRGPRPSLCLSKADAEELCRVNWCQPETLNWCE
jgi:hypothetical protein